MYNSITQMLLNDSTRLLFLQERAITQIQLSSDISGGFLYRYFLLLFQCACNICLHSVIVYIIYMYMVHTLRFPVQHFYFNKV